MTVAMAVLVGLQAVAPAPQETVEVWTARRDLSSGTVLQRTDLAPSAYSPDTVPDGTVDDPGRVVGRTLAAPMSRGEVLTETRTVASGLLRGYPGATAVPLRVTDAAVVDLMKVGDRVSFVVADPDGRRSPTLLLRDVPVVAIPGEDEGGPGNGTPGRLVVAAVPTETASEVAATAAMSILIPVWHR
jgi:pilus assembly protein CpaB